MAAIDVITKAREELENKVFDLVSIVRMIDGVAGDNPPEWFACFFGRVLDIDKATDAYMTAVHEHAMPVLRDVANLAKAQGGMGAVAPMVTRPTPSAAVSRVLPLSPAAMPVARPDKRINP